MPTVPRAKIHRVFRAMHTPKKGACRAFDCRLKLDYTYGVVQGNFVLYADLEISLVILKEPNISGVFRQLVPVLGTIAEVIPRNSSSQPSHTANRALAELLPVPSTRWIFWAEHYPARTSSTPAHRL